MIISSPPLPWSSRPGPAAAMLRALFGLLCQASALANCFLHPALLRALLFYRLLLPVASVYRLYSSPLGLPLVTILPAVLALFFPPIPVPFILCFPSEPVYLTSSPVRFHVLAVRLICLPEVSPRPPSFCWHRVPSASASSHDVLAPAILCHPRWPPLTHRPSAIPLPSATCPSQRHIHWLRHAFFPVLSPRLALSRRPKLCLRTVASCGAVRVHRPLRFPSFSLLTRASTCTICAALQQFPPPFNVWHGYSLLAFASRSNLPPWHAL